tara:strand:- start:40 stop:825 length:786 start_codon:yes stop_codon:yes gene_type:complete
MSHFFKEWKKLITEKLDPRDIDLSSFEVKDTLTPDVWEDDDFIKSEVKKNLKTIAEDFLDGLDIKKSLIDDIIITGSGANYNWSRFSDVDLHILLDFSKIDENIDLVKKMFDKAKIDWNRTHDINIGKHQVEIYAQDTNEPHVSTGVYSVLDDKWVIKPNKFQVTLQKDDIKKKAAQLMEEIDEIEKEAASSPGKTYDSIISLKKKIQKMRRCGLEKGGEFSVENLAFKVLRRNGYLQKLSDMKLAAYDSLLSLEELEKDD